MNVQLIAHTQLSEEFRTDLAILREEERVPSSTDGQVVALTAIRNCYSANKPTEIVAKEGERYFGSKASDGGKGSDADRLIRFIVKSGHTDTLEHITFTFAIEGVSRALLAQLTRHRVGFSFSVKSQRYVRLGSGDKSGGFDYVTPEKIGDFEDAAEIFDYFMYWAQNTYDILRANGVPPEDARAVLPNATATDVVMTANLRALLDFYDKRRHGHGAQKEIADLSDELRSAVVDVEPWTAQFFEAE